MRRSLDCPAAQMHHPSRLESFRSIELAARSLLDNLGVDPFGASSQEQEGRQPPPIRTASHADLLRRIPLEPMSLTSDTRRALQTQFVEQYASWELSLHSAYTRVYISGLSTLHDAVITCVKSSIDRFNEDIFNAASVEDIADRADSGAAVGPSHGHSSSATAILEKAFERAHSITMAEKHRLAAATGLEPRQVTIWFQNRRNRKTKQGIHKYHARGDVAEPVKLEPEFEHDSNSRRVTSASLSTKRKGNALHEERLLPPQLHAKRQRLPDGSILRILSTGSDDSSVADSLRSWDADSIAPQQRFPSGASSLGTTVDNCSGPSTPSDCWRNDHSPTHKDSHRVNSASCTLSPPIEQLPLHAVSVQAFERNYPELSSGTYSMQISHHSADRLQTGDALLFDAYGNAQLEWDDLCLDSHLSAAFSASESALLSQLSTFHGDYYECSAAPISSSATTPAKVASDLAIDPSTHAVGAAIVEWPSAPEITSQMAMGLSIESTRDMFVAMEDLNDMDTSEDAKPEMALSLPMPSGILVKNGSSSGAIQLTPESFASLESWTHDASSLEYVVDQWSKQLAEQRGNPPLGSVDTNTPRTGHVQAEKIAHSQQSQAAHRSSDVLMT
ncbi:homeodomain transcription factor bw2 [Ceraceosorus bombacis]|uniref:Homeodomain transcription factor bw2 n=1 Tax=Ceraceosorus bombacis TaxID=401625 RepID=A0A0P1BJC7_9BASI|nr:homeodomain transcription factor bw2 [Ceraceosorus bombacis]